MTDSELLAVAMQGLDVETMERRERVLKFLSSRIREPTDKEMEYFRRKAKELGLI